MIKPTLDHEQALWQQGYRLVAGIDEVGRGAWAGPVVAAAAIWPSASVLPDLLRDSKQLSPRQRQTLVGQLQQQTAWAIGQASVEEITRLGIAPATFLAMARAANQLSPDFYLIDAFLHPDWPADQQQAIVHGDATVASIAAASVIAKVYRDTLMAELDHQYPGYYLAQHKGYGTAQHQQAIQRLGLSSIHRHGFKIKAISHKV